MRIQIADLPEASRTRLLAAVKNPPVDTFVVSESKLGWAVVGLIAAPLCLLLVSIIADGYKWGSVDIVVSLSIVIASFVGGWISLAYLFRWTRNEFKAHAIINPLYFIRIRFDRVEAILLASTDNWDVKHGSNSKGIYTGTKFYFQSDGHQQVLKINSLGIARDLVAALKRFPAQIADLLQKQDVEALHAIDLIFEWRARERQFPRGGDSRPGRFGAIAKRSAFLLLPIIFAVVVFFSVIVPYNDYRDDEHRWSDAKAASSATAYRLYVALRPDGRHLSEGQGAIARLYEKAASDYVNSAGTRTSQGTEAVIKMLEYAKTSGHYKVFVEFKGENEIPANIEDRLRATHDFPQIISLGNSFSPSTNETREGRILEKIAESFGKVIPGDILQFAQGKGTLQDVGFVVSYTIHASGGLYYPTDEEHLPENKRNWYTGISFDWAFHIDVPGSESSQFQLSLRSEPAQLFQVTSSGGFELAPTAVYSAMADSAFGDFGSKLVSQLAVK